MARPDTRVSAPPLTAEACVLLPLSSIAPIIVHSEPVPVPVDASTTNRRHRVELSVVRRCSADAPPLHATLHGAARATDDPTRFTLTLLPRDVRAHCLPDATTAPPAAPTLWLRTRSALQVVYRPIWVIAD